MSASEKLRALDASVPPVPWATTPVTQLKAIRDALPQIVAVVEAAERAEPVLVPGQRQNMHGGQMVPTMFAAMTPEEWDAILVALTALDEALA